jgi:hypothetical protein
MYSMRFLPAVLTALALPMFLLGCSGSSSSTSTPDSVSLSLSPSFVSLTADGTVTSVIASVARSSSSTNTIAMSVSGLPAGVTANITQPGSGSFGTLLLASSAQATPGVYMLTVSASDGTAASNSTLTITLIAADGITVNASSSTTIARQDGTPASVPVTVSRSYGNAGSIVLSASGLPAGLTASYSQPGTGTGGTVTFTTSTVPAAAGTYTVTLSATDGKATGTTTVSVIVAVVITVANATDTTIGVGGHLQEFMSTGFQPSTYDNFFFPTYPNTSNLAALNAEHIRLQPAMAGELQPSGSDGLELYSIG